MARPTIFVLDDDPTILRMAKSALKRLGDVREAALWSQISSPLLTAARVGERVVLVCDLEMPGINGAEFCRIVRRHAASVRIVIFSSKTEDAPEGVADAVIPKQAGITALVKRVQGFLDTAPPPTPLQPTLT